MFMLKSIYSVDMKTKPVNFSCFLVLCVVFLRTPRGDVDGQRS